ncbi:Uncharacterized protein dnl_42660 [Desulfonema limicola]|uniref:Uncharacterized protein n=1 Tax=Desulfonema limicola TaxID=45656 RepID=A0A975BAY9_9BACT|nr:hypothetical protein [Desulfonema limicola]QTA81909.1 Uncharacterized protein dnl_42660 [Desulfonema limicola]
MDNVPEFHKRYWYLPFYTAFDYMFFKHDYLKAAQYLEKASKYPGSPAYLPLLTARLYVNANDPEVAIAFLREMESSTESKELKERLNTRIKEVMTDRDIRILETARDRFLEKNKTYPDNLEELVSQGFIRAVPQDPFGGRYYISDDHAVKTTSDYGKLKLEFKKGLDVKAIPIN